MTTSTDQAVAVIVSPPPFRVGAWVLQREVNQPMIARVRALYRSVCDDGEWVMDLTAYSHTGEKVGRKSPACGEPKTYEPAVPCRLYEAIKEPRFPLRRDGSSCWRWQCEPLHG